MNNADLIDVQTKLDGEIKNLIEQLNALTGDAPEYEKTAGQLEKLCKIRYQITKEEIPEVVEDKSRARLKDWIPVIGSIAGVLTVVTFESFGHILTSKGMAFVGKAR